MTPAILALNREIDQTLRNERAWQQFLDVLTGQASSAECPTLEELEMNAPNFQHRHYVAIAKTIAAMPDFAPSLRAQRDSVMNTFADMLQDDNERFDRERFLAACRGEPSNKRDR